MGAIPRAFKENAIAAQFVGERIISETRQPRRDKMSISLIKQLSQAALLFSFIVTIPGTAITQVKSLDRRFDPVVFDAGEAPPLSDSLIIAELTAFRYDAASEQWIAIPFQIDELDDRGRFFREAKGYTDFNDEVVFMPGDAGDRAPETNWLNDDGAKSNSRIEVEMEDPLKPGNKAWIYLFRKISNPPTPPANYITYQEPAAGTGADAVEAPGYVQGHAVNGWPDSTVIKRSDGSQSPDLVDRQKTRLKGIANLGFPIPYEANEQDALVFKSVQYGGGMVRGYRELEIDLTLGGPPLTTASFVTQYFPYSTTLAAKDAEIPPDLASLVGVQLIRQSVDLSPAAAGMSFYNAFNLSGVPIDGQPDSPDTTVADDEFNWLMASGTPGTLLILVTVPSLGSTRNLYYHDDANGGTADGTTDTGDNASYGDFGVQINGSDIAGKFSLDLTTYHLDPSSDPAALGEEFKALHTNRLQVTAREQNYVPTRVSEGGVAPRQFQLHEAFPNPFSTRQQNVRIRFELGRELQNQVQLTIYNLLGQEMARFADLQVQSTTHEIVWDGRDLQGQTLPAGIYFYKLTAGNQQAVKKLVLTP